MVVFSGVGFLFSKLLRMRIRPSFSLLLYLGLCFSALFFSIVQFFVPLTVLTFLPVLLFGILGITLFAYYTFAPPIAVAVSSRSQSKI